MTKNWIGLLGILLTLMACNKNESGPFVGPHLPQNFPTPVYDLSQNEVTEAGFTLGKKLFYERILSRDSTISCAVFGAWRFDSRRTSFAVDPDIVSPSFVYGVFNRPAIGLRSGRPSV